MTVYDPLRHKEVTATPEEQVRQWFIGQLRDVMKVPVTHMMSEVGFKYGGKSYRADIVVYDREGRPAAVVECKRPDVVIDNAVATQAMKYDMVLDVRFIILTNGNNTYIWARKSDRFVQVEQAPQYEQIICRQ